MLWTLDSGHCPDAYDNLVSPLNSISYHSRNSCLVDLQKTKNDKMTYRKQYPSCMDSDVGNPVIKNVEAKLGKIAFVIFEVVFFYCKMQFLVADSTLFFFCQ